MKKKTFLVLAIFTIFISFIIIDILFHEVLGRGWDFIHNFFILLGEGFTYIFYINLSTFFFWNLIGMFILVVVYIISYNAIKKRRLGSTSVNILCVIGWLIQFELFIIWSIFGLISNPDWPIQWKIILLCASIPLLFLFLFLLSILSDITSFWIDIIKERHDYSLLSYRIETENNTKIVHINTDATHLNTIWSAAIYILIDEVLKKENKTGAISRFIRSIVTNIFFEIATHFNFWPRSSCWAR